MKGQSQSRRGPGRRWCLKCRKRRTLAGYDHERQWCRPCCETEPTKETIKVGEDLAMEAADRDSAAFSAMVRKEQGV